MDLSHSFAHLSLGPEQNSEAETSKNIDIEKETNTEWVNSTSLLKGAWLYLQANDLVKCGESCYTAAASSLNTYFEKLGVNFASARAIVFGVLVIKSCIDENSSSILNLGWNEAKSGYYALYDAIGDRAAYLNMIHRVHEFCYIVDNLDPTCCRSLIREVIQDKRNPAFHPSPKSLEMKRLLPTAFAVEFYREISIEGNIEPYQFV